MKYISKKIGSKFQHHNQPYGTVTFTVEEVEQCTSKDSSPEYIKRRALNGWMRVSGTVTSGGVTNRLFQHKSFTDYTGKQYTIECPRRSYEQGHHTDVAM